MAVGPPQAGKTGFQAGTVMQYTLYVHQGVVDSNQAIAGPSGWLISVISAGVSGPRVSAAAFCSAWAAVRMPGIGTVRGLRASGQPGAPWRGTAAAGRRVADGVQPGQPGGSGGRR